jgi:NADPH:quinone reductase-like Zn-dependent oxidoreductase
VTQDGGGTTAIQAAAIPETFFTVRANVVGIGGAQPGDRMLVHGGTSGIGSTALMLARGGRLLTIGYLGGETGDGLNLLQVALKRAVITGSTMRHIGKIVLRVAE